MSKESNKNKDFSCNVYKDTENNLIFDVINYKDGKKNIAVYSDEDYALKFGRQCIVDELPEDGEYYVVDRLPDDEYYKNIKNTEVFKKFIYALDMKRVFSKSDYKRLIYYCNANDEEGVQAYVCCDKSRTVGNFITSVVLNGDNLAGECEIALDKASKLVGIFIEGSNIDLLAYEKLTLRLPDKTGIKLRKFNIRSIVSSNNVATFNLLGCSKVINIADSVIAGIRLNSGLHIAPAKLDMNEVTVDDTLYISLNRQNLTANTLFIANSRIKKLILSLDNKLFNEYDNLTVLTLEKAGKGSPNLVVIATCDSGTDYKVIGMDSKGKKIKDDSESMG